MGRAEPSTTSHPLLRCTLGALVFSLDELIVHLAQSIGPAIRKGQEKADTPGQKGCHRALPGPASVLTQAARRLMTFAKTATLLGHGR